MQEQLGIVYVLTNPAMPGLVKIGKTSRASVDIRLSELYTTGVPVPFECAFAGRVDNEHTVERAFHQAFGPYRLNASREFFEIDPEQAIALLELLVVEDVTPTVQAEANAVDKDSETASKRLKSRRPTINYIDIGIPVGSNLRFYNNEVECEVINGRQVCFHGENFSLTKLTQQLLETDKPLQPARYWYFEGKNLLDIYHEACD